MHCAYGAQRRRQDHIAQMHHGSVTNQGREHPVWRDRSAPGRRRTAPASVSVMSRRPTIFPLLSVEENLLIGLPARRDGLRRIPEFIEMFPVLHQMLGRRGGDLSGGQQQQLAIGRALVTDPRLLILDEPTEGIQPNIVSEIGNIVRRLNREMGLTVLLVEQKLPFARKVADRFCLLDRGRAVATGGMAALNEPDPAVPDRLGIGVRNSEQDRPDLVADRRCRQRQRPCRRYADAATRGRAWLAVPCAAAAGAVTARPHPPLTGSAMDAATQTLRRTQGWQASLHLGFRPQARRTVLAERRRLGPLAVQRPFYPEGGIRRVYLLHPPGGVVGGTPSTSMCMSAAALTRWSPRRGRPSSIVAGAPCEPGSTPDRGPGGKPGMAAAGEHLFPGAQAMLQTNVELQGDARPRCGRFTVSAGRPSTGFESGRIDSRTAIVRDGVPLVLDRLRVSADNRSRLSLMAGLPVGGTCISATPARTRSRPAVTCCWSRVPTTQVPR